MPDRNDPPDITVEEPLPDVHLRGYLSAGVKLETDLLSALQTGLGLVRNEAKRLVGRSALMRIWLVLQMLMPSMARGVHTQERDMCPRAQNLSEKRQDARAGAQALESVRTPKLRAIIIFASLSPGIYVETT